MSWMHHEIAFLGDIKWPVGNYGLIESAFGCPRVPETTWFRSAITLSSSNVSSRERLWSFRFRVLGPYNTSMIRLNLCGMRSGYNVPSSNTWSPGNYCLAKVGDSKCPEGNMWFVSLFSFFLFYQWELLSSPSRLFSAVVVRKCIS